jgi:lipopolysaccharide transport system permease protein
MSSPLTVDVAMGGPTSRAAVRIGPRRGLFDLDLRAVWQYRELLYFLAWRETKVRYKQTLLGVAWAIFQPLLTVLIFAAIFGRFAGIPSDGLPYPVFAFAGLLPWTYFAEATVRSSTSLVSDANLLRKVYFPRLIIPLAATVTPVVDFGLTLAVLLAMMQWYGVSPTRNALFLPCFLGLAFATALAVGLWLSALNVKYRDVRHTVPFLMQVWMYASPIVYPVSLVPEQWRLLFALNPMTGVIEGFRWGLLGKERPDFAVKMASAVVVAALLLGGLVFFRRMERIFADVV